MKNKLLSSNKGVCISYNIAIFLFAVFSSFGLSLLPNNIVNSAALESSFIAKNNEHKRVEILTDSFVYQKNNFITGQQLILNSYLTYCNSVFTTKTNFYLTPLTGNEVKRFSISLDGIVDCEEKIVDVVPSTHSEFIKQYDNNGEVDYKSRIESIDLYCYYQGVYKTGSPPIYITDITADKFCKEQTTYKDLLGKNVIISDDAKEYHGYIRNIISTREQANSFAIDGTLLFTANNISYSKMLKILYGNFFVGFDNDLFDQGMRIIGDFDSEFFKIKSYLNKQIKPIIDEIDGKVSIGEVSDQFILKQDVSKSINNGFAKNKAIHLIVFIVGIFFLLLSIAIILFSKITIIQKKQYLCFNISSIVTEFLYIILGCFFYSSFVSISFYFSVMPLIVFFIMILITTFLFIFKKPHEYNE